MGANYSQVQLWLSCCLRVCMLFLRSFHGRLTHWQVYDAVPILSQTSAVHSGLGPFIPATYYLHVLFDYALYNVLSVSQPSTYWITPRSQTQTCLSQFHMAHTPQYMADELTRAVTTREILYAGIDVRILIK